MTTFKFLYRLICMLSMVLIGEWTYHWSIKKIKPYIYAGIIYFISLGVMFLESETIFPLFIVFYIGEFVAWSLICKGKIRDKVFKMLGIICGIDAVQLILKILCEMLAGATLNYELVDLILIGIIAILFLFIAKKQWYKNVIDYFDALSNWKKILILCAIQAGSMIISFGNVVQKTINSEEITAVFKIVMAIEMIAVTAIIMLLIVESYEKKYYLEQNALKEEYILIQKKYYESIYEKEIELRRFRHDIKSQLGLLGIMAERGDCESVKKHLESIDSEFSYSSFSEIHIGNELLDVILGMMHKRAYDKGLRLDVYGKLSSFQNNYVYELCAIFSNAIENAIEACIEMKCDGPIKVKVLEHNNMLCCFFENPSTEEMYQKVLKGVTSKSDKLNHGYGVSSISRAVKRLGGSMEYHYESGKIVLEVYI